MIEDAEVDRVSHTPSPGNEVLPERPFFFRADSYHYRCNRRIPDQLMSPEP
jgi:hypothetical protein